MSSRDQDSPGNLERPSTNGSATQDMAACELCLRGSLRFSVHHLVPRAQGGRFGPRVKLCSTCHGQLHALFSTSTLARELNSIEGIRANPQMANYLRWVRKQQDTANFRVRRSNKHT